MKYLTEEPFTKNEYTFMIYDILRTLTMQITVQIFMGINNKNISVLNSNFLQVTLFLILGTIVFWMIVYKYLSKNNIIENYLTKRNLFN